LSEEVARERYDATLSRYEQASEELLDAWRELTKQGVYLSPPPSPRFRLEDERKGSTLKIDIMSAEHPFEGYLTTGDYGDGRLGEIFLVAEKMGSFVSGILDAFATAVSVGLQHGVPLSWYIEKFKYTRFEPAGMTRNPQVGQAFSILDYMMKWLEHKYMTEEKETTDGSNE
jgi:ribonucleoside-diphosphate reductase alpha chain